jgi:hypothetical protein
MYSLKHNPTIITHYGIKMKLGADFRPLAIDCPNLPREHSVKVTLIARPLLRAVAQKLFE